MIILIDQDNVLANIESGFANYWSLHFPNEQVVLPEARLSWEFTDDYPESLREEVNSIFYKENFFLDLPPIPGAKEGLERLMAEGHEVFICTAPVHKSEHCIKEKQLWVKKHLGEKYLERMIVTRDKTLIHGDILIDDKPNITGRKKPTWKHILFEAPYNKEIVGFRMKSWEEIDQLLQKISETIAVE